MLHGAAGNQRKGRETRGDAWCFHATQQLQFCSCPEDNYCYKSIVYDGSPVRIRTSIDGVRVRSLTVRRPGNIGRAYMPLDSGGQAAELAVDSAACKNLDILTASA